MDIEPPSLAPDGRRHAEIEHRPVLGEVLARRQALVLGARVSAGEELALAGPALLAARELALRGRHGLVGHVCHLHDAGNAVAYSIRTAEPGRVSDGLIQTEAAAVAVRAQSPATISRRR